MGNLDLYNRVRAVPDEAQKAITGGRLKGFTDINPMWRIKTLTEEFGPCGVGWYPEITDKRVIPGAKDEMIASIDVALRVKVDGEWSHPITGTGGAMFVSSERSGLFTSDEAFKMAYTDAISVCCKLLGFAADVYWWKDLTKYDDEDGKSTPKAFCADCGGVLYSIRKPNGEPWEIPDIMQYTQKRYGRILCGECMKKVDKAEKEREKK